MMYYYNDFYPTHMFGFGFVFMFLFWGLIIFGLVMLLKRSDTTHHKNNAIEILKE